MKTLRLLTLVVLAGLLLASTSFACGGKACGTSCSIKTAAGSAGGEVKLATTDAIPYPIGTCLVTHEKLGSMGDPVVKVYNGREIKFCCNGCVSKFEKNQSAYFDSLDTAIASTQLASYPLQTCVVTGEKLGKMGPAVDYIYQNRLVRFCCNGCISTFEKDPAKYLKMIDDPKTATKAEPKAETK
jgi:YHS domain-containing protein